MIRASAISPELWTLSLSTAPVLCSKRSGYEGGLIRKWNAVDPESYPPLDHHCLTMHLGQPRRIVRQGEGAQLQVDVRPGALSITPAEASYRWETTGPVGYAEMYIGPATFLEAEECAVNAGSGLWIGDRLGIREPLIEALFGAMLGELAGMKAGSRLYLDTMERALIAQLVRTCGGERGAAASTPLSLSPARLRRVLDFIEAHLKDDLGIDDLAACAAISPYHFARAFSHDVGTPPYAYLIARRVARAKRLLGDTTLPIAEIATAVGFRTEGQFCRMFARHSGTTPRQFRAL